MNHLFGSSDASDSAGQPWAGRTFQSNPAAGDDGSADPAVLAAIAAFRAGEAGQVEVVEALREARLLVALLAEAGDVGEAPDGRRVDKTQELSIVSVAGPDGRVVLPVFTSVGAMRAWNPLARPVPVEARRVGLAAGQSGQPVILDPTSPTEFALRRPALRAIATRLPWVPAWQAEEVVAAFAESIRHEPLIAAIDLLPGDPDARLAGPELFVVLAVEPGLEQERFDAVVARLQEAWQLSDPILQHADSLGVKVVAAS